MKFKTLMNLLCIFVFSFSADAASFFKLYEVDDTYNAKCTGKINSVDIKTISQLKIYANSPYINNNFSASVKVPNTFETYNTIFTFDVPTVYQTRIEPKTIWDCPAQGWFQARRPCAYKQISSASYVENVLIAQRQIIYLSPDDSGNATSIVTSNLSMTINENKTINLSFQKTDSKNEKNNESYQCSLTKI